ncbi:MAG: sulfatase [Planctomycetales bacterium]|nr:sulfatase [Planctomycetales bacterium]
MRLTFVLMICLLSFAGGAKAVAAPVVRNVIFVLSDDHRYDYLGCHPSGPAWLETPNMDRMAAEGVRVANAFVATSLCSPSRASILTGRYMHHHQIVDNQRPEPPGTISFPQILQAAGVETAFVGKWHMGHDDDRPRPGFDHWASYKGQGVYTDPVYNVNGKPRQFTGYDTDVATDLALEYLAQRRDKSKPFFLYLSYKAPHYPFQPAPRHKGRYADKPIDYPETRARTERNYRTQPNWVRQRRYSIHGIDHMETGPFDKDPVPDLDALVHSYAEAVHSVDENLGRVLERLKTAGLAESTMVIYMGDNGFHLGEHGFYDKRDAFETSIRVPLLVWAPGAVQPNAGIADGALEDLVQNIDIAPTILEALGVAVPAKLNGQPVPAFDGRSFLPQLLGRKVVDWRDHILYEYHWEWNFPATPTMFAIRTDRYKFVYYHGTWDIDSFHDLKTDPIERHNLIDVPEQQERIAAMRAQLFRELAASGALSAPVRPPEGDRLDQRKLPD